MKGYKKGVRENHSHIELAAVTNVPSLIERTFLKRFLGSFKTQKKSPISSLRKNSY